MERLRNLILERLCETYLRYSVVIFGEKKESVTTDGNWRLDVVHASGSASYI